MYEMTGHHVNFMGEIMVLLGTVLWGLKPVCGARLGGVSIERVRRHLGV